LLLSTDGLNQLATQVPSYCQFASFTNSRCNRIASDFFSYSPDFLEIRKGSGSFFRVDAPYREADMYQNVVSDFDFGCVRQFYRFADAAKIDTPAAEGRVGVFNRQNFSGDGYAHSLGVGAIVAP
jgi:hypothetical protein